MHQGHNIPWTLIESNFEFKQNDTRFTPPFNGLVSTNKQNVSKELRHFIHKFVQAIWTFSDTERAKYPTQIKLVSEGNLFSDGLRNKYPEYLNEENQRTEYWIRRAKKRRYDSEGIIAEDRLLYDTTDGDLADVVKVLLYENEMESLLMMANHPEIPVGTLHHLSWGHHFGFSRVKESAIRSYLFFNAAEATGILHTGQYTLSDNYESVLSDMGGCMDFPAQQIPHQEFLKLCGVFDDNFLGGRRWIDRSWVKDVYLHLNHGLLKEHMKTLFALIYRYDVLMKECALDPLLDLEIAQCCPINRVVKVEKNWSEREQQWVYELC